MQFFFIEVSSIKYGTKSDVRTSTFTTLGSPPACCAGSLPISVSLCLGLSLFLLLLPQQLLSLDSVVAVDEKQQIVLFAKYAGQGEDMGQCEHRRQEKSFHTFPETLLEPAGHIT